MHSQAQLDIIYTLFQQVECNTRRERSKEIAAKLRRILATQVSGGPHWHLQVLQRDLLAFADEIEQEE